MKPGGQRRKGHSFERKIARDMRAIFDGADLVAAIERATPAELPSLLWRSRVRRGEQGRGAHEPDVLIVGSPWWIECGDGAAMDGVVKWAQAARDCPVGKVPVAITHRKRERRCTVTMTVGALIGLAGEEDGTLVQVDYESWCRWLRGG